MWCYELPADEVLLCLQVMIHKPGKGWGQRKCYRPITLCNNLYKVLDGCLFYYLARETGIIQEPGAWVCGASRPQGPGGGGSDGVGDEANRAQALGADCEGTVVEVVRKDFLARDQPNSCRCKLLLAPGKKKSQ